MHVSLAAETIFHIGSFPVTNSLFTLVLIVSGIIIASIWVKSHLKYENPAKWQLALEMIVDIIYGMVRDILGEAKGKLLFAFLFNFFVIIICSNWFGLLPFVFGIDVNMKKETAITELAPTSENGIVTTVHAEGSDAVTTESATSDTKATTTETENASNEAISFSSCLSNKNCYLTVHGLEVFKESAHVFRAPSSDLSFTVALAIISIFVTNFLGFKYLHFGFAKRYINFSNPINFIVGIIELFSEISKLISFSFRLFGNIFAGEMLLLVITTITVGIATLPFYALEIFVGLIQAFVFLMLTTVFIKVAINTEH